MRRFLNLFRAIPLLLLCIFIIAGCKSKQVQRDYLILSKPSTKSITLNGGSNAKLSSSSSGRAMAGRKKAKVYRNMPKRGTRTNNINFNLLSSGSGNTQASSGRFKNSGSKGNGVANDLPEEPVFEAGKLTATEINDFQKWELWQDIADDQLSLYQEVWKIYPRRRYIVQVTNEEIRPLVDARVELRQGEEIVWEARTDNRGRAELWLDLFVEKGEEDRHPEIVVKLGAQTISEPNPIPWQEGVNFITFDSDCTPPNALDIAFVVDATGSMGDEIGYLKTDLMDVLEKARERHPDLDMQFGSVFYKCPDNDYITRKFDLSSNFKKGIDFIKQQDADGGGVESVEVALGEAVNDLDWRKEARARLLFLVLDESPGRTDSVVKNMQQAIREASALGIHVIPVVTSGTSLLDDRILEYLMRTTALATNGTCAFLTDDSGIGNDHTEPVTDEMVVEILGELMGRLIDQYVEVPPCDQPVPASADVMDTTWVVVEPIPSSSARTLKHGPEGTIVLPDSAGQKSAIAQIAPSTSDSTGSTPNDPNSQGDSEGSIGQSNPDDLDDSATSSDQPTESGFRFYPNPTNGPLTVEFKGDVKDIFITDPAGKIIQHLEAGDQHTIKTNLSRFPAGTYFVRYIDKDRVKGGRLVLVR